MTIGIDKDIEQEWLIWITEKHIPAVMNTGMFVSSKFYKVLHDNNDGTISFSVQFFAQSLDQVEQYLEIFAPALIEEHRKKFLNKHVVFQTLLEEV